MFTFFAQGHGSIIKCWDIPGKDHSWMRCQNTVSEYNFIPDRKNNLDQAYCSQRDWHLSV